MIFRRLGFILFLMLAAGLSFLISREFSKDALASVARDPLQQILGSSKEIIGDAMFIKADEYFHGGVIEKFNESDESIRQEGAIEEVHDDSKDHGHQPGASVDADWIAAINRKVASHEHFHLSAEKRKEMLPFFALSTALDPHNMEAILSTAYWLQTDFNKTDDAIKLLEKAVKDNPDAWQYEYQMGLMHFKHKKDYALSERYFRQALNKTQGKSLEYFERVDIYFYLAEACANQSKKKEAISSYKEALRFLEGHGGPLQKSILQKISAIDKGQASKDNL